MGRVLGLLRFSCLLTGLLFLVISFTPLFSFVARWLAVDWFDGDADVLVVLGGSMLVDGTAPQATLGYDSYLRCNYASWNMLRHRYSYIVLSGSNGLAETMGKYLIAVGAKPERVLIENAAQTTFQNAEFVKRILDHQVKLPSHPTIALLTSDYHTRRARLVFERWGMPVRAVPVPDLLKRNQSIALRWSAFLDLSQELVKLIYYKLTGKI